MLLFNHSFSSVEDEFNAVKISNVEGNVDLVSLIVVGENVEYQEEVIAIIPEAEIHNEALVESAIAEIESEWTNAEVRVVGSHANIVDLTESGEVDAFANVEDWSWDGDSLNVEIEWLL